MAVRASRLLVVAAVVALFPLSAKAIHVDLSATAGYWFLVDTPQVAVDVGIRHPVGEVVSLGLRVGVFLDPDPFRGVLGVGAPVDALLRFTIKQVYIDLFGGPWFVFTDPFFVRVHAGVGVGVRLSKLFSIGIESAYLQPGANVMARFTFYLI